jgi:acetyl-CoA carboxylase biotin carboxyl carrier protein
MARKKTSKAAGGNFAEPEIEYIEQLLKFMTDHNLEEFEYSRGDLRIRLRKPSSGTVVHTGRAMHPPEIIVAGGGESAAPAAASSSAGASASEDLHLIKSPIVGTFYGAPSPGAENFVKVGSHVEAGQTLCIVEAMKLMNEIESDASGEITRVYVENGQPVEYGQPLFGIRAARKK